MHASLDGVTIFKVQFYIQDKNGSLIFNQLYKYNLHKNGSYIWNSTILLAVPLLRTRVDKEMCAARDTTPFLSINYVDCILNYIH